MLGVDLGSGVLSLGTSDAQASSCSCTGWWNCVTDVLVMQLIIIYEHAHTQEFLGNAYSCSLKTCNSGTSKRQWSEIKILAPWNPSLVSHVLPCWCDHTEILPASLAACIPLPALQFYRRSTDARGTAFSLWKLQNFAIKLVLPLKAA